MRSNARVLCDNQPHPVQQTIGDTTVTTEASVDDSRMENICSDSAGRVSARVELLREQHVGKLAVVIIPARKIMLCVRVHWNVAGDGRGVLEWCIALLHRRKHGRQGYRRIPRCSTADIDDARGRGGPQQWQQQLCEIEVSEVVHLNTLERTAAGYSTQWACLIYPAQRTANWLSKPSGVATNVGTD